MDLDNYKIISKSIRDRELIRLQFDEYSDNDYDVYLFSRSDDLLFGAEVTDFAFNFYFITRLSDVVVSKDEQLLYSVLHRRSVDPDRIAVPLINVNSWRSVFASAFLSNRIISVEGVLDGQDYCLYGLIKGVERDSLLFASFDLNGEWDKLSELPLDSINTIVFCSRYINTWQKHFASNPIFGAVSDKDERYYTHMSRIFDAMGNEQLKYNWLISDCECMAFDPKIRERMNKGCIISGEELTMIIYNEDFQWIWGVLSAFSKDVPEEQIMKYPAPVADRYSLFGCYPSISHPFAQIEITAFDSSCVFFNTRDKLLLEKFIKSFPKSEVKPVLDLTAD